MLKEKLKRLKARLKTWNREQYGDTFKKYKKIEGELNQIEAISSDRHLSSHESLTRKQLQEEL